MTLSEEDSCTGKKRYSKMEEANREVVRATLGGTARNLNAYRCIFCKGYHIGHRSKKANRDALERRKAIG